MRVFVQLLHLTTLICVMNNFLSAVVICFIVIRAGGSAVDKFFVWGRRTLDIIVSYPSGPRKWNGMRGTLENVVIDVCF